MQSLGRKIVNFLGLTSLGTNSADNSLPVVLASDHNNIPVYVYGGGSSTVIGNVTTVGTPATKIPNTPSIGRYAIQIQNVHATSVIHLGTSSGVTAADGWKLLPGESVRISCDDSADIWAVPAVAHIDVRYIEEINK